MTPSRGRVVIVSGPSGAGKSTVVRRLMRSPPVPLQLSVSVTTRPPRHGERDGVDYRFVSEAQFSRWREEGKFLECTEVFGQGHWYGTLLEPVATGLAAGRMVILEIDVQGAEVVRQLYPNAITIFLHPGDEAELEKRLRNRRTETEEALQRRLAEAQREMEQIQQYQHVVVNRDIHRAAEDISDILRSVGENSECMKN